MAPLLIGIFVLENDAGLTYLLALPFLIFWAVAKVAIRSCLIYSTGDFAARL